MNLRSELERFEPPFLHGLGPKIPEWARAEGCWVYPDDGRKYLDFGSGLMTANAGHNDIGATLQLFGRTNAWLAPNRARLRMYRALSAILPAYLDRFVPNVTGGEAVETAVRIAMAYQDCPIECVTRSAGPSYHGNSYGLQQLAHRITEGFDVHPLARAVVLCPFEGPTCRWWSDETIEAVNEWQRENGGLVIIDECQSGMGRTGLWWGFEHTGLQPDLVVMGKSLGNGWPISCVAGRHEIMDKVEGDFVSTYSGQSHCCNAVVDAIDYIQSRDCLKNAAMRGYQVAGWAEAHDYPIHGLGLARAIKVPDAGAVIDRCLENGLLLLDTRAHGTVKIVPPLTITSDEMDIGLGIIEEAISAVGG